MSRIVRELFGPDRLSWLGLACVLAAMSTITDIIVFSKGGEEEYGKDVGSALLLAGAGSLLLVMRESTRDAKPIVVAARTVATLFGFSGALIVLYYESPVILFVLATLIIAFFLTTLYGGHIVMGLFAALVLAWRRLRRQERDDVECVWCDNKTSPQDGICRSCWNWIFTGDWP